MLVFNELKYFSQSLKQIYEEIEKFFFKKMRDKKNITQNQSVAKEKKITE